MASFRAASDLVTFLIANLTMANVAALTNRPIVQLAGVPDSGGDVDSGIIEIVDEIFKPVRQTDLYRNELYFITATYSFFGTSETTFKEMVEEIDLTIQTENQNISRSYFYELDYIWDTNVNNSVAYLNIVLTKSVVKVDV